MRSFYCALMITLIISSCGENNNTEKKSVDLALIDSLKKTADTSFYKELLTEDFAAASYYGNRKDSVLMQIMKGSDSSIKQIIVTKNDRRIYYAQFYDNGQQKALYNFDGYGTNDGASSEFHENGQVKEMGIYNAGYRIGEWTFYDSLGNEVEKKKY